ncbi:hypothetical protein ACFLV4_06595 [Chloroflexota bacterium]
MVNYHPSGLKGSIRRFRGIKKNRVKAKILIFLRLYSNSHRTGLSAKEIAAFLPSISPNYLAVRLPVFAGKKPDSRKKIWDRPLVLTSKRDGDGTNLYRISSQGLRFIDEIPPFLLPKLYESVVADLEGRGEPYKPRRKLTCTSAPAIVSDTDTLESVKDEWESDPVPFKDEVEPEPPEPVVHPKYLCWTTKPD